MSPSSNRGRSRVVRLLRAPMGRALAGQTDPAGDGHADLIVVAGAVALATAVTAAIALAGAPTAPTAAHRHLQHHHSADAHRQPSRPSYALPADSLLAKGDFGAPALSGDTGTVGVPAGTPAAPTTPDTRQVAARTAAIASYQGGPGSLTPAGIATLAMESGCTSANAVTATAISLAESGGRPGAQGDIALMDATWDWSAGLWQIRGLHAQRGTGGLRDSVANQDATKNATAMFTISSGCTSWGPWTTYTRGTYRQFLNVAGHAVDYVDAYLAAHGNNYPPIDAPDTQVAIPRARAAHAKHAASTSPARTSTPAGSSRPGTMHPATAVGSSTPAGRHSSSSPTRSSTAPTSSSSSSSSTTGTPTTSRTGSGTSGASTSTKSTASSSKQAPGGSGLTVGPVTVPGLP